MRNKKFCKRTVSAVLTLFFLLAGKQYAYAASISTGSMHLSVTVVEDCIVLNANNIQIASYSGNQTGGATDFEFNCGLNMPYQVQLNAGDNNLYNNVITESDFGEMFHVEVLPDNTYKVEKCDSLSDVPAKAKGMPATGIVQDAASGGFNVGTVNVTVQW